MEKTGTEGRPLVTYKLARCSDCADRPRLRITATHGTLRYGKCPGCGKTYLVFEEKEKPKPCRNGP